MEQPLTAAAIVEMNREYYLRKKGEMDEFRRRLDAYIHSTASAIEDIYFGRVANGWPTRDGAGDESC